jgi:hypothetical protein
MVFCIVVTASFSQWHSSPGRPPSSLNNSSSVIFFASRRRAIFLPVHVKILDGTVPAATCLIRLVRYSNALPWLSGCGWGTVNRYDFEYWSSLDSGYVTLTIEAESEADAIKEFKARHPHKKYRLLDPQDK